MGAYAIVYNPVRLLMLEEPHRQGVDVERISFVDALRRLAASGSGDPLPKLVVNPHRPGRCKRAWSERWKSFSGTHSPACN